MDRRIQKTREAIRKSYFDLLKQKKDGRVSVAEVAREANIDRKTFYLHYNCIEDVWRVFCDEKVDELFFHLRELGFLGKPFKIEVFFDAMNEVFENNKDEFRVLSNAFYQTFSEKVQMTLVQALIEAYSKNVTVSKEYMKIYCDFFVSGLIHLYRNSLTDSMEMDIKEIEEVVLDIAKNGISNIIKTN